MKIYKIAQSSGGGSTKLVLIIDKKTGAIKTEIIGHDGAKSCANSSDEDQALLRDLMEAEVDGIGSLGEVSDSGENALAMKELMTRKTPATPITENTNEVQKVKEKSKKRLDVGGMDV